MMQDAVAARTDSSDDLLEDVFSELDVGNKDAVTNSAESNTEVVGASGLATGASPPVASPSVVEPTNPPTEAVANKQPELLEPSQGTNPGVQASTIDDYYASSTTWTEQVQEQGDNETANSDDEGEENPLNQAIPVDKLKNGARTAMDLWSWGFGKVKEAAAVAAENERVKQASQRMTEAYDSNLRPGVEKVREAAAPVVSGIKDSASSAFEASKPKIEELRERAAPAFEDLGNKTSDAWDLTKAKAGELGEACRPGIDRAAASTREILTSTGLRKTYSNAPNDDDTYEPFSTGKPIVSETVNPLHSDI